MNFLSLDKIELKGKFVLVRVDINAPIKNNQIVNNERFKQTSNTIKFLSDNKSKVVILGHQGRPGNKDYRELKEHAKLLWENTGKPVEYVNDIYGETAITKINSLTDGEIILLKNVRSLEAETENRSAEEHNESEMVKTLEPMFDYFVNDAFSVSHRSHASVVGFINIPNIAGRTLEKEIKGLNKVEHTEAPLIYIFGGAKPTDAFELLKINIDKINAVLTSGFLGQNFMIARGFKLGKQEETLRDNDSLLDQKEITEFTEKNNIKIKTPKDFAYEKDNKRKELLAKDLPTNEDIKDIGTKTIDSYKEEIAKAKTIYFKGPAGVFEEPLFEKGTKELLNAVANSNAFSIMGGGHTVTALDQFNISHDKINYLSLAGGALEEFIAGKTLPGLKALEESYEKFKDRFTD